MSTRTGRITADFGPRRTESVDLAEHRELITDVGLKLSGRRAISISREDYQAHYIIVYRTPFRESAIRDPRLLQTEYGTLTFEDDGPYALDGESGDMMRVIEFEAEDALGYLTDLTNFINDERRKAAMHGNALLSGTSREATTPSGALGGLVKEYDRLLDQLKGEYFVQKRRADREGSQNRG